MSKEKDNLINEFIHHYKITTNENFGVYDEFKSCYVELTIGLRSIDHVKDSTWHIHLMFDNLEQAMFFLDVNLNKILNVLNYKDEAKRVFEILGEFNKEDYLKQYELEQTNWLNHINEE